MSENNEHTSDYLYDAVLTRIDPSGNTLVFTVGELAFTVVPFSTRGYEEGSVGRLRLNCHPLGFGFHQYADPRLRRDREHDDSLTQRWGWRLGDRQILVREGMLPGLDGAFIPRDTEWHSIELPREFIDFCGQRGLTPLRVLRAFVGDLCGLISWIRCPREDGYTSYGSDERLYASAYFDRTFGDLPPTG